MQNPAAAAAAAAAAMYLGVGHKMFLEQEAQRLKEAAEHHHHQQQQQHQAAAVAAAAAAQHQHHQQQREQQQQQHQQQQQQLQQQQQHHMQQQQQQSAPPMPPPPQHHHPCGPPPHHHHAHPHPSSHQLAVAAAAAAAKNAELHERFPFFRNPAGDLEGLADMLKSEISSSLNLLIDTIVSRYAQQRRFLTGPNKQHAEEQLNKDLLLASQLLDRKSPRTKVIDRGANHPPPGALSGPQGSGNGLGCGSIGTRVNGTAFPINLVASSTPSSIPTNPDMRPPVNTSSSFQPPKTTAAALPVNGASPALYPMGPLASPFDQRESPAPLQQQQQPSAPQHPSQQQQQQQHRGDLPEQNEALSLVVTAKKKRHKVTDTRITPRTVSRILSQEAPPGTPNSTGATTPVPSGVAAMMDPKYGLVPSTSASTLSSSNSPSPRPYHPPPPPMLPVSLPTSVAIPNPSLHESQVFSPYSPFYGQHHSSSPPDRRDAESPLSHPPSLLHPALLAAHGTPDYARLAAGPNSASQADDRGLDQADSPFDGMQPPLSFSNSR
jgi:prospero homeobox 1